MFTDLLIILLLAGILREIIEVRHQTKSIERNTRVLKTDVLLKRRREAILKQQGDQVRESIKDEEHFKD